METPVYIAIASVVLVVGSFIVSRLRSNRKIEADLKSASTPEEEIFWAGV
jgi:hypothetical protein